MSLFLDIVLVATSVMMILLVLLHRAKGGGLSSLFGGGMQTSLSGSTVAEKNLTKLTIYIAIVWAVSIVGMGLNIRYA
ncbi:preprotein translocase subunit SecG [Hoyosella altamirensis]|uniref:Protein-export membrane protein SecG n=1 Tax=Hoyosella altamirensis TaxID=616997 RepID=A0A839RU52_9ACTN|nr:preprotein translocase subunit SecG [Hoyosella altamirensis]MBB3039889.1 preprotein translocase subunit SecG [Hoyosella altamirensis]